MSLNRSVTFSPLNGEMLHNDPESEDVKLSLYC